jgi:hypothetical protein
MLRCLANEVLKNVAAVHLVPVSWLAALVVAVWTVPAPAASALFCAAHANGQLFISEVVKVDAPTNIMLWRFSEDFSRHIERRGSHVPQQLHACTRFDSQAKATLARDLIILRSRDLSETVINLDIF